MSILVTGEQPEPYLSVVVTTRNDDHGGDPLKRLQAFVNTFAEQCRRTRLDAETEERRREAEERRRLLALLADQRVRPAAGASPGRRSFRPSPNFGDSSPPQYLICRK